MPTNLKTNDHEFKFRAYVSEPITRCPKREKGRIKTLLKHMRKALLDAPYQTQLYIPSEVSSPEVRGEMAPEHVYLLDRIRVVESDFMMVIADQTSFGIGGEVEMATSLGKPVIIFSREENLSRFLVGTPANSVRALSETGAYFLRYREWRDLKLELLPLISQIQQDLESARREGISFVDVGQEIKRIRELRKMSVEDLASSTGLRPQQLRLLEKPFEVLAKELADYQHDSDIDLGAINFTPHQLEELANVGLPAIHKIAIALEVPITALLGDEGAVMDPTHLARTQIRRLKEIRTESLKQRASQYDITFREYVALEKILVEDYVTSIRINSGRSSRQQQIIEEEAFKDALAHTRGSF